MANVRFFLDVRRRRKTDGKSQLQFQINHRGKTALVPLGVFLSPEEWDAGAQSLTAACPLRQRLDIQLRRMRLDADAALLDLGGRELDARGVAGLITGVLFPERVKKEEPKRVTVLEVARRLAAMKGASTRETYLRTIKHVERFRPEATLDEVGRGWLMEWDAEMARACPSPNGRAIHMRNLRAVFNFAIDEGWTQNYPFRKFKIKRVATAKRSLPVDVLRRVLTMDVEGWQEQYRDFFALSFYLIGTNAKDILELPEGAYQDGRIVFNRSKTKKLYSIRVEPEAAALINAQGQQRKEQVEQDWMNADLSLGSQINSLEAQRQANTIATVGNVAQGAGQLGGAIDDFVAARKPKE